MSARILVTGGTGFIGTAVCALLCERGFHVRRAVRRASTPSTSDDVVVGEIDSHTHWTPALAGIDSVIHLAARVHVLDDSPDNALAYTRSNADATSRLAQSCAQAGVRRLLFLSSVKVNGEVCEPPGFDARDIPAPQDAYGKSKWLAEQHLREIAAHGKLQVAIVRPPLVFGPGVRANFLRLLAAVERGIPLPLASIDNRRSVVSVWNLCDLLVTLLDHPAACAQAWFVCETEQLSTPELVRRIAGAMQRKARLVPVPKTLLRSAARLAGRTAEFQRLAASLVVNDTDTRRLLAWSPPLSMEEGLRRTVVWYRARGALAHA